MGAHLECLFALQDVGKCLACFDSECIASKVDLFEVGDLLELIEVRLNVGLGIEFETLANEGEDLGIAGHRA